ncbi:KR domain [Geosmithia morbida]|uniref:KR domain n=1 Tax=Geosmithia morbida TaxID=1094350 RepID=A0A9P5D755_9HYPO|nr:KR domain [Geosmithia morbida]KAF4124189.1 KR domain [Geosmithia morbida]
MSLPGFKKYHKAPYDAISPPSPSWAAKASKAVIVGRRSHVIDASVEQLSREAREAGNAATTVDGYTCDLGSTESTAALWEKLAGAGTHVNVLKYLINVSTVASYMHSLSQGLPTYDIYKNAGTLLLWHLARAVPASQMQIVSHHPGAVLSEGAKSIGAAETHRNATTDLAEVIRGRFFWENWDVNEVREVREVIGERISRELHFLTVGVEGLIA